MLFRSRNKGKYRFVVRYDAGASKHPWVVECWTNDKEIASVKDDSVAKIIGKLDWSMFGRSPAPTLIRKAVLLLDCHVK